ncbi:hypothetical protein [Streptomyces griseiscabiei]|uniref:NUDIX hydrolase n=2 Tax=Streptomyces griseiscabiei TaxID=2993540 RepID=A0ABU4LEW5_9ACTN|nr:hypothetical protein [Streptomyces griseiscabiei]MBZ3907290.1 hypothetical protein [Streptomyces griseiscabiei]MDX2914208.1 hypothetical protein [Streptomyces griseiscabiei]
MRWTVQGERTIHDTPWVRLRSLAVERPDGTRGDHITDTQHFVFRTDDARRIGAPTELNESDRVEWIPLTAVPGMITRREIVSGATLVRVMALLLEPPPPATA